MSKSTTGHKMLADLEKRVAEIERENKELKSTLSDMAAVVKGMDDGVFKNELFEGIERKLRNA